MFLEAAPRGTDPEQIGTDLAELPGVVEVHDLHLWEITSGEEALSAHVLVDPDTDCHGIGERARALLHEDHQLDHATLQIDHHPARGGPQPDPAADHCHGPHGRTHRSDEDATPPASTTSATKAIP